MGKGRERDSDGKSEDGKSNWKKNFRNCNLFKRFRELDGLLK